MSAIGKKSVPHTRALLAEIVEILSGWPEPAAFYLVASHDGKAHTIHRDEDRPVEPRLWQDPAKAEHFAGRLRESGIDAQVLGPYEAEFTKGDERFFDVELGPITWKRTKGSGDYPIPDTVDMMCWTLAAFNKFVAPYYFRQGGSTPQAAQFVDSLRQKMKDSNSGIFIHHWPTSPDTLTDGEVLE